MAPLREAMEVVASHFRISQEAEVAQPPKLATSHVQCSKCFGLQTL
jgi:hypothetical protein